MITKRPGIKKQAVMWTLSPALLAAFVAFGQAQSGDPVLKLTATTSNLSSSDNEVRIDLTRWSTDEERAQLVRAWTTPTAPEGEGGGRGGRGRGGGAEPAPPPSPAESLATALGDAPTVGYLWSSAEVAGYSIRYAVRVEGQEGGDRIVLVTSRRLGEWNNLWDPATGAVANDQAFSLVELRLNSSGMGEGKASLAGGVTVDRTANTLVLDGYDSLPVVFESAMRATP